MKKLTQFSSHIERFFTAAFIATMAVLAMSCSPADAQTLKVATGSAKLTYSTMFKEMVQHCGNTLPLVEVNSNGSMDNVDKLVGNEVNAGFVQSDVLWLRARTEELGNVKTLLALHNEQVHIIAPVKSGLKAGGVLGVLGVLGVGGSEVVINDITGLAGQRVAATGGSAVTAKVIRLQSEIPFTVVEYPNNDAVIAAVTKGEAAAAIVVGGQPLPLVRGLNASFKLLAIPPAVQERLKGVYRTTRLNYSNLNAAGVPTVATDALLVTREYKTERMVGALASFRGCVLSKVDELKETTGTHPAWQAVDAANRGKWAWYELGARK